MDSGRCIMALTVAASVVDSTGFIRNGLSGPELLWPPFPNACLPVGVEHKLDVAAAPRTLLRVIAGVLAAAITIVAGQFTVPLVLGELEARAAFTGNAPLGSLPANVGTAVVLVHAVHSFFWPLDTGVLVVTEEEAISAMALVAAHHVDTALLAATVALCTLIHIQTVVSVMCQVKSVVAGTPVITRDVDTVVHTACVVLPFTLIHVFAVLPVPRVAGLADALVRPWGILADGIDVAIVRAFHTLIYILRSFAMLGGARVDQQEEQAEPGDAPRAHGLELRAAGPRGCRSPGEGARRRGRGLEGAPRRLRAGRGERAVGNAGRRGAAARGAARAIAPDAQLHPRGAVA